MDSVFGFLKEVQIPVSVTGSEIIRVNRMLPIPSLGFGEKEIHPELKRGPSEYNKIILWNHKNGITGYKVYEYLKNTNALGDCLSLQDGLKIKDLGVKIFRKLFENGTTLYLWQTIFKFVTKDRNGTENVLKNKDGITECLFVPYVCSYERKIIIDLSWLGNSFSLKDLAVQFGEN